MNKVSKLFQPVSVIPKNALVKSQDITSKSQKLMLDLGLIRATGCGSFYLLPLLQKSLEKCLKIMDFYMYKLDAQKITIPQLTSVDLWKKSGRFESGHTELLTTKDRHNKSYVLGPTHEEAITNLLASVAPISYRSFPLRLYQISTKFRDELKPRFGLMRSREFLMKDCYSFDISQKDAVETYEQFNDIYKEIFQTIGVPFVKVQGDTGIMGGSKSHEFHFPAEIGEDSLVTCSNCSFSANREMIEHDLNECPQCEQYSIQLTQGIEVAHTFLLDDKYSKILGATYLQSNGKPANLLMGCYGIGVTRLLAASIESLSLKNEIRWPFALAPYTVCLIPPKDGSKEQSLVNHFTNQIYRELDAVPSLKNSVIIDDRCSLTIGKRLMEAKRFGYPIIIVIGPTAISPNEKFEFHLTNTAVCHELSLSDVVQEAAKISASYFH